MLDYQTANASILTFGTYQVSFIKACIQTEGLLFLKIIIGVISQVVPQQCWGKSLVLKDLRWYCQVAQLARLPSDVLFSMFCTLIIILLMVDRAFNKRMSIKIKVTSMTRASRDHLKFTPEAYSSTHNNVFQSQNCIYNKACIT